MKFEYNQEFEDFNLPWSGHKILAYDLVKYLEPKVIVALGT